MNQTVTPFLDFMPVMGMQDGFLLSKGGDLTVGFELTLPRVFGIGRSSYESLASTFISAAEAFRDAPFWVMIHRQDVYRREVWHREPPKEGLPWLEECRQRHFDGREYMTHRQYLFISLTSAVKALRPVGASGVFGRIAPAKMTIPEETVMAFTSKVNEYVSILSRTGLVGVRRLSEDEILGTESSYGLLEEYLYGRPCIYSDIRRNADSIESNGRVYMGMEICEADRMPGKVSDCMAVKKLCGEKGDIVLSAASALGPLLDREHIVNQYILIPAQEATLQRLETRAGHMVAMGKYSDNNMNAEGIMGFIRDVKEQNLTVVYGNINVVFWGADRTECEVIAGEVAAAFSLMDIRARRVTRDFPVLWYAGLPGAECEIGADHLMLNTLPAFVAQGIFETFDDGMGGGLLQVTDRLRNRPVLIDTHAFAYSKRFISNYNVTMVGPSGSGKSFTTNRYVDACYTAGESVFIIDVGASYELHCRLISEETGGRAGRYYSWDQDKPLRFNPLDSFREWLSEDGSLAADCSGFDYFLSLLRTMWTPKDGWNADLDRILEDLLLRFARSWKERGSVPVFNDFYDYVNGEVSSRMKYVSKYKEASRLERDYKEHGWWLGSERITDARFDIGSFQINIAPYAKTGRYGYLLNNAETDDLFSSPFICFDLRALTANGADKTFYSVVVFSMMNAFDGRMRSLPGFKNLIIDEAWQAIDNPAMSGYLKTLWKTARKYSASCVVVTQELDDILSSEVIGDAIINNSDIKVVLPPGEDERILSKLRSVLGLSERQMEVIGSLNRSNNPRYNYREAFFSFGTSFSGAYGIEPCEEELLSYESEFEKKAPTLALAAEVGSLKGAVVELAERRRNRNSK